MLGSRTALNPGTRGNCVPGVGVRNINQRLVEITPGRTLDSIQGVCKSLRYQELLASLQREAEISELLEQSTSDSGPGAPDNIPKDPMPGSPAHNVAWATEVRDAIYHLAVPDGIDIDALVPGSPTRQTRDMLDSECARWLPHLAKPRDRAEDWTTSM